MRRHYRKQQSAKDPRASVIAGRKGRWLPLLWSILLWSALLALVLTACADDSGPEQNGDTDSIESDADGGDNGDTPDGDCSSIATEDADGDGLPNAVEDKNLNCQVDEGETDWQNADTDGDGLTDGQEDVNGNGLVDDGEFSPLLEDTDGNGVLDIDEPLAAVCLADIFPELVSGPVPDARSLLVMPPGWTMVSHQGAGAGTFGNADGSVVGWVIERPGVTNLDQAHSQVLVSISTVGFAPVVESRSAEFGTWELRRPGDPRDLPARPATRAKVRLEGASGTLGSLRDQMASAITEANVAGGETGPNCTDVTLWNTSIVRDNGTAISLAVMSCSSVFSGDPALDAVFDDLTNGTHLSLQELPRSYQPDGTFCENLEPSEDGGVADILWVVDNSGSMEDEQEILSNTAGLFVDRLIASGIDWRLGVAMTEVWGLDPEFTDRVGTPTHDELVDFATGLRGLGFLTPADDVTTLFDEYVTYDEGCERPNLTPVPPVGSNLCGSGREAGLESGLWALEQLASGAGDARHSLRDDAVTLVVWVSDEEDQRCVDGDQTAQQYTERYLALDNETLACAIVGDVGVANGGFCQPLVPPDTNGADHGACYQQVATNLGGPSGSICNANLDVTVDDCINTLFRRLSAYELSKWPISGTISVAIDGDLLSRSRENGWIYDHVNNKIVFFGVQFSLSSTISVSYRTWEPSGN